MARLAPQSSRRRNVLLLVAGVAVLVAAAFSPIFLRPSVLDDNGAFGGSWTALPTNHQVITMTQLAPANWPGVDVRSVGDVPGASVAQAWLIDEATQSTFDDAIDEADFDSGVEYLTAAMPALDVAADSLPSHVDRNESAMLVVLWNIENCDPFAAATPELPRIELRTIVRTSRHQTLPDIAAPSFSLDTLRESGTCP